MSLSKTDKDKLFQKGLLEIAQQVHMSVAGGYLDLYGEEQIKYVDYLRRRLHLWVECKNIINAEFDLRVKDLITTAIDEYDDWAEKNWVAKDWAVKKGG